MSHIQYRENELNFFVVDEVKNEHFVCVSGKTAACLVSVQIIVVSLDSKKEVEDVSSFTAIDSLSGFEIVSAYTGDSHSLFQTKDGKIISGGLNKFRQLLLSSGPSDQCVYVPKLSMITEVANFCVAGIGCSVVFVFF